MAEESRSQLREFQLETRHLAGIVVLIAILCISSFLLGRWVERQAYRASSEGGVRTGDASSLSVEDVNKELTYFRTLEEDHPQPPVVAPPAEEKPRPVRVEAAAAPGAPGTAPQEPDAAASAEPGANAEPGSKPPSPAAKTAAPATSARGGVLIQVMATKDRAAAAALRERLAAKGYPVSIADGTSTADSGVRRVRVGPYTGRAEAEKIARKLRSEEGLKTWIP